MTTKHSIYIVNIHGTEHAVRATGKRAAQAFAIDKRIHARLAEADDIVRICRSGVEILGEPDQVDPNQLPLDVTAGTVNDPTITGAAPATDPIDEAVAAFTEA